MPDTLPLFSRSVVSDSFATPRTGSFLSIGFPRQEYWNELPFPPPGDLPNPGMGLCLCLLHRRWILYRWGTGEEVPRKGSINYQNYLIKNLCEVLQKTTEKTPKDWWQATNLVFLPSHGCSGKSVLSTARHQGGIPRSGTPGLSVADGRAGPRSLSKLRGAEATPGLVQPSDYYHGNRHRLPTAGAPLLAKPKSPHSRGQLNGPEVYPPHSRDRTLHEKGHRLPAAGRRQHPFRRFRQPPPLNPGSGRERKQLVMLEQTWPPRRPSAPRAPAVLG